MNKRLQNKLLEKYAEGFQAACDLVGVDSNRLVKRAQEIDPMNPVLGGHGPYANSGWRRMPAYAPTGSLTVGARSPTYTSDGRTLPARYGIITSPSQHGASNGFYVPRGRQSISSIGRQLLGTPSRVLKGAVSDIGRFARPVAGAAARGGQNLRSNLQQLGDPGFYSDVGRGLFNHSIMPFQEIANIRLAGQSAAKGRMQRDWQAKLDAVQNQPYNLTFRDRFRRQIPGNVRYGN